MVPSSGCVRPLVSAARDQMRYLPGPNDVRRLQRTQANGLVDFSTIACVHVLPSSHDTSTRSIAASPSLNATPRIVSLSSALTLFPSLGDRMKLLIFMRQLGLLLSKVKSNGEPGLMRCLGVRYCGI